MIIEEIMLSLVTVIKRLTSKRRKCALSDYYCYCSSNRRNNNNNNNRFKYQSNNHSTFTYQKKQVPTYIYIYTSYYINILYKYHNLSLHTPKCLD